MCLKIIFILYVPSPGKESIFKWDQIQSLQMPLSFSLFSCSLHVTICAMCFVLLKWNCKTLNQKQQYIFLLIKLQHLHGYGNYWICLTMFCQSWPDYFTWGFISKMWLMLYHVSVLWKISAPKSPQFTPPLGLPQPPQPTLLTVANFILGS